MWQTRKLLLAGAAVLMPAAAFAQAPAASGNDCDRLVTMLDQQKPANAPVTLDQARTYKSNNNAKACREALANPAMAGQVGNTAQIQVQQSTPRVTVQQGQPNVTVNQPQPEITVHQPAPTVTVDIPQPDITIRMAKPQVNVAMTQPQVQVSQDKPQVQVLRAAQPQVSVQNAAQQPNVQVQDGQQAPKINYTTDKAKVVVNQPQGEPNIRMEQADQASTQANAASAKPIAPVAATTAQPNVTANTSARTQPMQASRLMKMNVVNARGDTLGDVEHVLMNTAENKNYVVIGHGGFLGMGEKQVALPLSSMVVQDGKLVMQGMTDDQIRAMPAWKKGAAGYTDAADDTPIQVGTAG